MQKMTTRLLKKSDDLPYHLLLLADETKEAINKYIHASDVYVAESDNEIIAVYALCRINNDEVEIKNIAVIPHLQNQGIGKKMLKDAELNAQKAGYRILSVATADGGILQLKFYQQYGFEIDEIRKNFITDNYLEPIIENGIRLKHMIVLRKKIE